MAGNLVLPGNPRYQPKSLIDIFGYDYLYVPVAEVELAGMEVLAGIGLIPQEDFTLLTPDIKKQILSIRTSDVDELERTVTKHDVRALVRKIQELLPEPLRRWVHVPFTSYDPLETGRILQFVRAHQQIIRPMTKEVVKIFVDLVRKYSQVLQIGRTHGQHALPITVGFWLATILNRLVYNSQKMNEFGHALVGKISGAVGANNAVEGLGIAKLCKGTFEGNVLVKLGLGHPPISTQILPPEPLAYFLYSCTILSASFAQFGRDCRHLMRSEIAEIGEPFTEGQVGSSTMAQKRNPINFENLEGMWLRTKNEFGKVLDTLISEHQRDLVGSCVARDFPIIVVNLVTQLQTLLRADKSGVPFLGRLTVNEDSCRRNFQMSEGFILAEPLYIALQMAGYAGDAHEVINRKAMPLSQKSGNSLLWSLRVLGDENLELREALNRISPETIDLLEHPQDYTGNAARKALQIAEMAEGYFSSAV